jgi:hypothetical protein
MNNEAKGDTPSKTVEPEVKSVSVKKPQSLFGERPLINQPQPLPTPLPLQMQCQVRVR